MPAIGRNHRPEERDATLHWRNSFSFIGYDRMTSRVVSFTFRVIAFPSVLSRAVIGKPTYRMSLPRVLDSLRKTL